MYHEFPFWHPTASHNTPIEGFKRTFFPWLGPGGEDFRNGVEDTIYRARFLYEMLKKEIKNHGRVWQSRYGHYKAIHNNVSRLGLTTSNLLRGLPAKEALARLKLKQLPAPELRLG